MLVMIRERERHLKSNHKVRQVQFHYNSVSLLAIALGEISVDLHNELNG